MSAQFNSIQINTIQFIIIKTIFDFFRKAEYNKSII